MSSLVNTRRIAEILDELYVAEASCQAELALDFGDYDIAYRVDHEVMVVRTRIWDRRQGEPGRRAREETISEAEMLRRFDESKIMETSERLADADGMENSISSATKSQFILHRERSKG